MLEADDVVEDAKLRDAAGYHKKAAAAWTQMNEKAKAAKSQVAAALCMNTDGGRLSKEVLEMLEQAIEAHVPDPLNPYARYRQTGTSAFVDAESDETAESCSAETKEFAKSHLVTTAYAHEPVQDLVYLLTSCGEYASALYAAGAVSTILESDGLSTLSLSRAYAAETILTLAMGDPVEAERVFLNRHVQRTFYLKSRECQLAEELFRAIKARDADALEEARDVTGHNRAALANLPDDSIRQVVQELRLTGVARKKLPEEMQRQSTTKASSKKAAALPEEEEKPLQDVLSKKTGYEKEAEAGAALDGDALTAELDELNFSGLDDSHNDDNDDELEDDDDIDLR
jgi:hypothetical protein